MKYTEDDLLPISALQHLVFCERQAALIHIERLWKENVLTVEGREMHERAHSQEVETSGDIHIVRGLQMRSLRLGLIGVADVVEFKRLNQVNSPADAVMLSGLPGYWQPEIVEYKHGQPKIDRCDEVQLCAQAMCLEEILGISIAKSSFFYGRPRRRHQINLDNILRQETEDAAMRLHGLFASGKTPAADYSPKCRACSLIDLCMPKTASGSPGKVRRYVERIIEEAERTE